MESWQFKGLLAFLVWRDVKVRYKQTFFGAAWAILQPLLLMIVFSIFLGNLARVPSEGIPYPLFAYSALVPWTLFAQSLIGASNSLVENANLVSKIFFPRMLLPIASVGSFVIDFCIALTLVGGMIVYYDQSFLATWIWVPALSVLAILAALAVGVGFAAINARYRDVRYAVPFLVQLWLFASPVAYPASLVPNHWRLVYGLNPMAGVVEGFRWAMLGVGEPPSGMLIVSSLATVVVLLVSLSYFKRVERTLADVI